MLMIMIGSGKEKHDPLRAAAAISTPLGFEFRMIAYRFEKVTPRHWFK